MDKIKKWWWAVPALLGLLLAVFKKESPWKGRAEKAQDEALDARHDSIDAKHEARKEVIDHEAEDAHADVDALSDDDIINEAIASERARRARGD